MPVPVASILRFPCLWNEPWHSSCILDDALPGLVFSSLPQLQDETAGIKSRDCSSLTWAPQAWLEAALELAKINRIRAHFLIPRFLVIAEWESLWKMGGNRQDASVPSWN